VSPNLQDLEIIDFVSFKLLEGFDGFKAANAKVRKFVPLSIGGAPELQARAGAAERRDGLVRNRAFFFGAL
jgi:hypothetical protein